MSVKARNQNVDILRGIAAVLMVLGHSFIVYPINISEVPWCAAISHFIYTFHMELFFILAGVVYHCVCYKEDCDSVSYIWLKCHDVESIWRGCS